MSRPWDIPGPTKGPSNPALEDALRRVFTGRRGAPTDADRPPVSTFPVTRAAREALRLSRGAR